jgi:hypothetical protein
MWWRLCCRPAPENRRRGSSGRLKLLPLALAIVVIGAVSAGGLTLLNGDRGSGAATAIVNAKEYDLSITRSLSFPPGVLVAYGEVTSIKGGLKFLDTTAYSVPGINPQNALVLRLSPGQRDDEPLGDYVMLVRGPEVWAQLCPYFDPTSPETPGVCR